jgi:putative endonuclease
VSLRARSAGVSLRARSAGVSLRAHSAGVSLRAHSAKQSHCRNLFFSISIAFLGLLPMTKQYYVYIMTNKNNTVLYTGVTNNLQARVYQHKEKLVEGFTKKYNVTKLVYYETTDNVSAAILREKQIKGGSRQKKIDLIVRLNPEWGDLFEEIV